MSAFSRPRVVSRPFAGGESREHTGHLRGLLTSLVGKSEVEDLLPLVPLGLARALAGTGGTVVCAMFSSTHIRDNVHAMARLSSPLSEEALLMGRLLNNLMSQPAR